MGARNVQCRDEENGTKTYPNLKLSANIPYSKAIEETAVEEKTAKPEDQETEVEEETEAAPYGVYTSKSYDASATPEFDEFEIVRKFQSSDEFLYEIMSQVITISVEATYPVVIIEKEEEEEVVTKKSKAKAKPKKGKKKPEEEEEQTPEIKDLGSLVVSLQPLLRDPKRTEIDEWMPLPDSETEIHVVLSVTPFLTKSTFNKSTFVSIKVSDIQNIPQSFLPGDDGDLFRFVISFNHGDKYYSFPLAKCLKKVKEMDENDDEANATTTEEEDAEAEETNQDEEDEKNSENIISWTSTPKELSFLFREPHLQDIEAKVVKDTPLYIYIRRILNPQLNAQEDWTDENEEKYRGVCEMSLAGLLEPGQLSVTGSFPIVPKPFAIDGMATPECTSRPSSPSVDEQQVDKKKKPDKKAKKGGKKSNLPNKPLPLIDEEAVAKEHESDPDYKAATEHAYISNQTRMNVTFSLLKPVVPNPKDRPKPNMKLSDLIPKREKVEKPQRTALDDYRDDITKIVNMLAEQFAESSKLNPRITDDEFLSEIQCSGQKYSITQKLKESVVQIVKDRFKNVDRDSKATQEEKKSFVNELYILLTEQMHRAINPIFNEARKVEKIDTIGIDGKPCDKWKRLADEAELNQNFSLAYQYHQKRISLDPDNAEYWFESACFSARVDDITKSTQQFREAVSINMGHLGVLQGYGVILCEQEHFKEAEVFLEAAIDVDTESALNWALLGLLFDLKDEKISALKNYKLSKKLLKCESLTNVRMMLIDYLLGLHQHKLASRVLLDESVNYGVQQKPPSLFLRFARLYMQTRKYENMAYNITEALTAETNNVDAWILKGDMHYLQKQFTEAESAYERAILVGKNPKIPSLYLRLGNIYLNTTSNNPEGPYIIKKYEDAKDTFLLACECWRCSTSFLGVAKAYYLLNKLHDAEQALNQANIYNNLNPSVWGYLYCVCMKQNRESEAKQALAEAMKRNLKDEVLLKEIENIQQEKNS